MTKYRNKLNLQKSLFSCWQHCCCVLSNVYLFVVDSQQCAELQRNFSKSSKNDDGLYAKMMMAYLIFVIFWTPPQFWSVNCTPEKCVNLRKNCLGTKPRKSIFGVFAVLVDILAVLVGLLAILVAVLGVLCIGMVHLLLEIIKIFED